MALSKVISGPRILPYVNGRRFASGVTSFHWTSDTPRRAVHCLDVHQPIELVQMGTRCIVNIAVCRLSNDGGAEGASMVAPYPDLSSEKYFIFALRDRGTETIIFQADKCSVLSQNWSIDARGVMRGQIQFQALSWSNEIAPANTPYG
jgi:hypothetical protein